MNTIIDRILDLMANADISARKLTETLNMSSTAITDWKKNKANPSLDALIKIAEYFNVSLDYLVFGKLVNATDINDILTNNELLLIQKYRSLSEKSQIKVEGYIDGQLASANVNRFTL